MMGRVGWLAEVVQGVIALALIAAYVVLQLAGKGTDHLDLGIIAILGVFFGGKVSQTVSGELRDLLGNITTTANKQPGDRQTAPEQAQP